MQVGACEKLHVTIGQVKTGQAGQSLHAILGSCIGLGILDPKNGVYGLAHCLLSKSDTPIEKLGGRHVDQAIYSLMQLMDLKPSEMRKLQGIVVGGANMTLPEDADPSRMVGQINSKFAYKSLREAGMRRIHEDVGGMLGRQITIDCTSGEFTVSAIPRLETQR
ncbi:chemotaxis protein CheD [Aestuariibius sp. HNIBRBA575]|uniref:chemotaxis protein CheD n=1 Tax=Aestuariibius sp. HNIBRBA575 TaxID=3233343 RepID=UPI0034A103C8